MTRLNAHYIALAAALCLMARCPAAYPAAAGPFPAASAESQGMSSQALQQLLDVVRGFEKSGDIVGGELLVIKNRRTVLHAAVGMGDREARKPLAPGTIYCIRSMTKPLVGAAVQILIDEGRLSLEDTAAKYLPSFDNDKSRAITVRQLLTHTGGLPLSSILGTNFAELASLRDVADKSGRNGPTVPPGTRFQYSDDGADTLAAIVAVIAREPAETFIAKRVLAPLGMRDTFPLVSAAGKKLGRFTPAYMGSRGSWMRFWSPAEKPIFPYFLGSQGMYSTAEDYARFVALYLDGGRAGNTRVLSDAAVRRTLEPAIAAGMPSGFPGLSAYYGQLMVDYVDAAKKRVAFGHSGSDGTWAYAWPEHDLMVLWFTQSRGNLTGIQLEGAIDRLLLGGAGPAPIVQEMSAETAAPYLGVYWLEPRQRPMIVVLEKDRLALEIPWQGLVELGKMDEEDAWSFVVAPDNSVKFHREGAGPATAFDLRRKNPVTLQRLQPEAGLPGLEALFALRPDRRRSERLASLGMIRMRGSVELSTSPTKGSFEILASGEKHARLTLTLSGAVTRQVVAADHGWMQPVATSPFQEMPPDMANATRRAGWLLSTGDWRTEFPTARVLKRIELDGEPVLLVHAAPEKGRHRVIYLDPKTGLTRGYDEVFDLPGLGAVGCEVRYSDYRDVEGVQIPFKAVVKYPTPMLGTQTYQLDTVETHVKIGADPFTNQ